MKQKRLTYEELAARLREAEKQIAGLQANTKGDDEGQKSVDPPMAVDAAQRRILIDQSRDGIVIIDQNGKVYDANLQFAQMLGYTREEALQLNIWDWETSFPHAQVVEMMRTVDAAGDHFETRHRRKDGSLIDVEISSNGAVFEGNKLIFCVCRDITRQKQAEAALEESENKYHTLFEGSNDGIVIVKDGKILLHNARMPELSGVPPGEFAGRPFLDFIIPEDRDKITKYYRDRMSGKPVPNRYEVSLLSSRRGSFPVEISARRIELNGEFADMAIIRDISERKKNDAAIRENEQKFRSLFETMAQGVIYHDAKGVTVDANAAAERILGVTKDQLLGKTYLAQGHDHLREDGSVMPLQEHPAIIAFQQGKRVSEKIIGVFNHALGEYRWLSMDAVPEFRAGETRPYRTYTTFTDITERRRMEETTRNHANLVNNLSEAVISTNSKHEIISWNPAAEKIFGWTEAEALGKNIGELLQPEFTGIPPEVILEELTSVNYWRGDGIYHRKDGSRLDVAISISMIKDKNGNVIEIPCIFSDITERKKAEERIRYHAQLLENVSDAIISSSHGFKIISWNKAAERIYGWKAEEVIGKNIVDVIRPAFSATSTWATDGEGARQSMLTRGYWEGEVIHQRKDGSEFTVLGTISILNDENGKDYGAVAIYKDLTEYKKLEENIRYQASLLESVSDAVISSDHAQLILSWNKGAERIYGWKTEEVLGKNVVELIHPVSPEESPKMIMDVLRAKGYWQGEMLHHRKDGSAFIVLASVSIIKDAAGAEHGAVAIYKDMTEQKRLEENIRYHAGLLENVSDAIISSDSSDRLVSWNKAAEQIFGWTEAEALGQVNMQMTQPFFQNIDPEQIKKSVDETGQWKGETTEHRKDGTPIKMLVSITSRKDVNGNNVGSVTIFKDITERKQAEEKLKESEERFNKAFHSSPNMMAVMNISEGRLLDVNETYVKITGYKREELIGKVIFDLDLWIDSRRRDDFYKILEENGRIKDVEVPLRTREGEIRLVLFSGEIISLGGTPCLVIAAMDITERKQFEERLNHLNLMLRSIRNVNQLITREKDRDKLIQGVCDNLVESHSFRSAWIVLVNDAQKPTTWASCNVNNQFPVLIEMLQQTGLNYCLKKALKTKDVVVIESPEFTCIDCPMLKYQDLGTMTIRLEFEGKIYGFLSATIQRSLLASSDEESLFKEVAMDISFALRDMELGISHQMLEKEQLRAAKLESIGTLAGGIAHDFNNFLTGIMGNIGLAKTIVKPTDEIYEMLEEAEQASIRARDLTRQLLTFSRGGQPVKKIIDIASLIRETASFSLRGSNVKMELNLPDDLWSAEADEGQISQVINNLVINADEAMPIGGTLSVQVSNLTLKNNSGLPLPNGNYIHISVGDTGIGMSQENLERIFEPYFTTKQRGSGLGLTSAYSIIKNHGGQILAESKLNKGSVFHIYLPASKKTVKGGKNLSTETTSQAGGKVLVMDDEEIIRKMLKHMLSLAGYHVEISANGREAVEIYAQAIKAGDPFDAVIMDLTIPGGMGGKDATKELLKIDPHATVIVSSGYANDPIMSEYKKYGFKAVIAKPYSVRQLQETLSEVTRRKKR